MDFPNTTPVTPVPDEASQGATEVTIPQANAILLAEALLIARNSNVPLGKSTLQRWAKVWAETPGSDVKAVLQVTRAGRHYEIDRDDFEAWLLQEAENRRTLPNLSGSEETSQDLGRPYKTPQEFERPRQTQQDPKRSHEVSAETTEDAERVRELEDEIMELKINLGARKHLLEIAKEEMTGLREMADGLLRENGALQYQLQQLPPGRSEDPNGEEGPSVDNPPELGDGEV